MMIEFAIQPDTLIAPVQSLCCRWIEGVRDVHLTIHRIFMSGFLQARALGTHLDEFGDYWSRY